MPAPTSLPAPSPPITITATPLTRASFAPFGSVIQDPGSSGSSGSSTAPAAATVNQGTARKHLRISPFTSTYASATSGAPASANVNLFVCRPRELSGDVFACRVLERHPFTSQTFIPLGLDAGDEGTAYVVIVAPTERGGGGGGGGGGGEDGGPVLEELRAFVCRGNQAVTYAAGTWHAPMVVVGEREVPFVVLVHENGVVGEDTQEVGIAGEGVGVRIPFASARSARVSTSRL